MLRIEVVSRLPSSIWCRRRNAERKLRMLETASRGLAGEKQGASRKERLQEIADCRLILDL
jgi:hypothetical protein